MRGSPQTLLGTAVISATVVVGFVVVAAFMVRRARKPDTVARDGIERRMLPLLKNPTPREKILFVGGTIFAGAAPWLTYLLER
jgi:hypothetical protein